MKTSGGATPIDAEGNKLEPEEQAATEVIPMPVDVTHADHPVKPGAEAPVGALRGMVGIESTAGEVAQSTATRCELCSHWRHDDWLRHLAAIEDTREGQGQINALRGELLGQGDLSAGIDEHDMTRVNLAIKREFGICVAFTESEGMVVAAPFYGGCPADDVRFKTRDREAQTIASAGYDKILRLAQGRND
jgi:hypothetical protein